MNKKIKIIGAGIFGCAIAYELDRVGHDVTIIEQDDDILKHASKCNHNRIHFGYHYPRSLKTAEQSLDGIVSFLINYKEAILSHFPNYYMISKDGSHISGQEYINFCKKVGIDYTRVTPDNKLVNIDLISQSILTDEIIYDHSILKSIVKKNIEGIKIKFNTTFDGRIDDCDYLINTTYASINEVNKQLGVPELKIRLQDVCIPYFEMKSNPFGLTVMDGQFCSVMPKGKTSNQFLLYSVKHSLIENNNLDINNIYKQSERYFPFLKNVKRLGYWRTKRALPINNNDERLSEIFTYKEHPKIINVLSGKVSTCHKIGQTIKHIIE